MEKAAGGEKGEICIYINKNKFGLFMGYFKDYNLNKAVMHDGWYHTGDIAFMDKDKYFWYVGRVDDIIKSSGYRIGPFEVESVLITHPAVLDCAVFGVSDDVRGQLIKANIVLKDGYVANNKLLVELQNFVKKRTAPYKYPRIIEFVDYIPKTVSGKIIRKCFKKI